MRSTSASAKIGYIHTFVEKVKNRGRDYLRVRIDMEQRVKRREDVSVTKFMYGTIETLDGQVLRLDTRTQAGGSQDLRGARRCDRGQDEVDPGERRAKPVPDHPLERRDSRSLLQPNRAWPGSP